jgi:FK506-binding nuclear protein
LVSLSSYFVPIGACISESRDPTRISPSRHSLTASIMFYGCIINPSGDPSAYVPPPDEDMLLHVSTACLDPSVAKKGSKATLMVKSGDEEVAYAVCSLREGGTESMSLDLALEEYSEFSVVGNCPVHVTGYFMPADDEDDEGLMPGMGDEDFDMDFDEDPSLLGYDEEGLPIYMDDGSGSEDEGYSEEDSEEDSDDEDDEDGPGGNVLEIKDVTEGDSSDDDDDDDDDVDDDDDDEDSSESEEEGEPAPQPAKGQKRKGEEPKAAKQPEKKKENKQSTPGVIQEKSKAKKYPNGFEIHDLKQGKASGKVAKAGKRVSMRYVGRLTNGKIFDQTKGKSTFQFRLGVGEVIKGWDRGVEGMRVGDKRKLVIPPQMGYGSSRTGPIPANSTLVFEVELVDVKG